MASLSVVEAGGARTGSALLALVAGQGSASHPWFASEALLRGPDAARNLADAAHFLCTLHGLHPGIVDLAAERTAEPGARAWLSAAANTFSAERLYLTRLAVAAGPVPGTPGGAASEAAVAGQRGALATLARSERRGCALGAALAFAADWAPVRGLLDFAAARLGIDAPAFALGAQGDIAAVADAVAGSRSLERALLFGAEQTAVQHRGLWDLLEARAQARLAA